MESIFSDKLYLKVVVSGAQPFICSVNGNVTIDVLEEIEKDHFSEDNHDMKDGEYIFSATYQEAQTGEFGRIEIAEHWELSVISVKSI
jgi:hypothetical protein